MPDTIVPIVRRPVRRGSTTTDPKIAEVNLATRKLSIGGETNSEQASPARLRRTWTPKESPTPERRRSLLVPKEDTKPEKTTEPAQRSTSSPPRSANCFPVSKSSNLPSLPTARNRPIKTSVSIYYLLSIIYYLD